MLGARANRCPRRVSRALLARTGSGLRLTHHHDAIMIEIGREMRHAIGVGIETNTDFLVALRFATGSGVMIRARNLLILEQMTRTHLGDIVGAEILPPVKARAQEIGGAEGPPAVLRAWTASTAAPKARGSVEEES